MGKNYFEKTRDRENNNRNSKVGSFGMNICLIYRGFGKTPKIL